MTPAVPANSQKPWLLPPWGWWLLVIGFALRLAYCATLSSESAFGGWDGKEYHAYAQNLAALRGDDYPRFFNAIRAPFYPVFLIPFVTLSPTAVWPIQAFQSLLGVLQIYLLAKITGRWAGARAGNWALVMATFHPFLIYFSAFVLTENLFVTALWLGVACLQQLLAKPQPATIRWTSWAAVALGVGCLTRPALQPFLVVAVLWVGWQLWQRAGWRSAFGHMTLFTGLVCALLLPWMIGNWLTHHDLSLSPGGAQLVFAQSNSEEYLKTYEAKTKEEYYDALTKLHMRFAIKGGTPPEAWLIAGNAFRHDHPEEWRRLQWYKIRHFWTPWLNPMIFSRSLFLVSLVSITPTFALAALEIWRRRKTWNSILSLLIGVVAVGFLAGGLMFHVQVRYRIPFVDVAFIVLSASWLGYVQSAVTKRKSMTHEQPLKILWISCVGEKGGAEVYMLNLIRHMDRREFAPAVAMLRPGPLADELRQLHIPVHVLTLHRMRNLVAVGRSILELKRIIREEGYAIVHSNGFRAHTYGGLAARLAGVPEVWSVFTVEKPGLSTRAILNIPTSQVSAICPRTLDYFVEQDLPVNLIWPGVDLQKLEQATPRLELIQRYGLPPNCRWISMGARLQRYKGQEYFIRALAALPPAMNEVHGIVMGGALFGMEQSYLAELKALAESLGVAARIHFTGFIPDADVYGFAAGSALLMHPALDEDFGLIVAEAQALGRPVLAYASVGPAAIVEDNITGRLVTIGDQAGLNDALAEMLAAPGMLDAWGQAGRLRSRALFGARTSASQMERVYRACAAPAEKLTCA